ncbi:MAG: PP2C family protein-serine/threonine phosphatase [Spirochaetes bacterium]|nr:PP2C family protein-serine/threonine phosphatase [Spirochaetota bacterium]MBU1079769.1 PP2C family protein-serine/threonine phosphatase [Spirochaetota bacterium]
MANDKDQAILGLLLSLLGAGRSTMISLDSKDVITGVLPSDRPFAGREPASLTGKPFASAMKADFVRVFDGRDGWDEFGYFADGSGERIPHLVRRFEGASQPFSGLFPPSARFILASPLAAYASLEDMHERAGAQHERELEEINRKLKRRSRKLKKAIGILETRNRQMIADLNLAVELQKSLLPKSYPDSDLISFTHRYIPMAMVGGDFFDIVKLSDHEIGVMISDVSGHGVAPAFITALIKSSFDYLVAKESGPAAVISRLNEEFSKIIETDHYVTACFAVFDFDAMLCRYCNAGHPPQLLAHADGSFTELPANNPIIGMLDDYEYEEAEVQFAGGDVICFYTDGIMEARDGDDALFGVEGVKASVAAALNESLDGMADRLITDLIQFMKDPYFEDDITMLFGQVIESL